MPPLPSRNAWFALVISASLSEAAAGRATEGLLTFYDFNSAESQDIRDRSQGGDPLDLHAPDAGAIRRSSGTLEIHKATTITSDAPADRLSEAVKVSGEITVEAWLQTSSSDQAGPARIITISSDSNNRNFTLGQDGNKLDARFRTRKTGANGIPSLSSPFKISPDSPTHVVYTRDRSGTARIYQDGNIAGQKQVPGRVDNWDGSYRLALGNELSGGRPWNGKLHLVAIYDRALTQAEVSDNFVSGPDAGTPAPLVADTEAEFFETTIAPILADQCLECHDASTHKGKLDLSQKATALAAGDDDGPFIVPGSSDASTLWHSVEADEMPDERTPLNKEEKELLREWIDRGATWSLDTIDPADYLHGSQDNTLWVQRLTVPEYVATVRAATGVDISKEAASTLPADLRADGFSNTAYNLNVDLAHVEAYAKLAEAVVERMDVEKFTKRFSHSRKLTDKSMAALIEPLGKWLLRGPVSEEELILYRGISTSVAAAGGDFTEAAAMITEAMLQSPRFLYRIERQRGNGRWTVHGYELASRLSYIIWGAPPDKKLFAAAENGELSEPGKLHAQVTRMFDDPRAEARSLQFASDWLHLSRLANLRPDPTQFPDWDPALAADMREESLAFFREVVWEQKRPMADLLNAQFSFLTPRLASHYGIPPQGTALARYDLAPVPGRGGILTQGSVLTVGGDTASMVSRGLFVLHDLLRGVVKDPPPGTDTTPVPTEPGLTQRNIASERIASKTCGGCHSKFEPLAFGLERFDGLGSYSETDSHGNPLREDGEILVPGTAEAVPYSTSSELFDLLAGSDRVRETLTWKLVQFSLGRPLAATDVPSVRAVHRTAQENGGSYRDVVTALVTSDLVLSTTFKKP